MYDPWNDKCFEAEGDNSKQDSLPQWSIKWFVPTDEPEDLRNDTRNSIKAGTSDGVRRAVVYRAVFLYNRPADNAPSMQTVQRVLFLEFS